MKYKEFKKAVEEWGSKYNYKPIIKDGLDYIYMMILYKDKYSRVFTVDKSERFVVDLNWEFYRDLSDDEKRDLFKIVTEFAATKPEDRKDEKRFIIPLPELVTTDGKQQYLTHKDCKFFACRRDETLQQIWKEEYLELIPKEYRQFAVEFDEKKEY